jgi:hypothetical protein
MDFQSPAIPRPNEFSFILSNGKRKSDESFLETSSELHVQDTDRNSSVALETLGFSCS